MKCETVNKGDIVLLCIGGRIGSGASDLRLREKILEQLEKGFTKIVLEMSEIALLDSSGLAELVAAYATVQRYQATVKLANPPARVRDLLDVTRISSVFEIYGSADEAVGSFRVN